MPRLLKRDYNTGELLEIAYQLIKKTEEERKNCYDTASRNKNSIELAYHRQVHRLFKEKKRQEYNAAQSGLF